MRMLVGVSGPDGAGKSSLVRFLREHPDALGAPVEVAYVYGCFICRRVGGAAAFSRGAAADAESSSSGRLGREVHALIDGVEACLRVAVARTRADGRTVVVTDRTPLDTLAKFRLSQRSVANALLRWLLRRYTVVVLLVAPAELLAQRDEEHSVEQLELALAALRREATSAANACEVDATAATAEIASAVRRVVASRAGGAVDPAGP